MRGVEKSPKNKALQVLAEAVFNHSDPEIGLLRATIARMERRGGAARARDGRVLRFWIDEIDRTLPGGGLTAGLHEIAGDGAERGHAAAPGLLAAYLLAHAGGEAPVLWVTERCDLFAPGLLAAGLRPDRLIVAEAGREVLAAMEEGARSGQLAGVVGELPGALGSKASRRLQLAAEASGVPVLAIRRPRHAEIAVDRPNASATRWRIGRVPSAPADPIEVGTFSLTVGPARWRLDLVRARGAEPASWIVEAFDETGRLCLPAVSADRSAAPARQAAGGATGDRAA